MNLSPHFFVSGDYAINLSLIVSAHWQAGRLTVQGMSLRITTVPEEIQDDLWKAILSYAQPES